MRHTSLSTLIAIVFFLTPVLNAQANESSSNPNQLFTSDLVAWTAMQTPKPIPGMSPQPGADANAPSAHPGPREQAPAPSQPTAFAGTIRKEGATYVLRTSDKWFYDLDDQDAAAPYENQPVAVVGTLNLSGDLIHIHKIEPRY